MGKYYGKSKTRVVDIGGLKVLVDSQLEEKVMRWLDSNGFKDRWQPSQPLQHWSYNYTPDLELSVKLGANSARALVEIKPARSYMKPEIIKRMIGVRRFYPGCVLLLYTDRENQWYEINPKNSAVSKIEIPTPGHLPISKFRSPLSEKGKQMNRKQYKKRFKPGLMILRGISNTFDELTGTPVKPRKRRQK